MAALRELNAGCGSLLAARTPIEVTRIRSSVGHAAILILALLCSGCFTYEGWISDPGHRDRLDWGNQPLNIATCVYLDSGTDINQAADLFNQWNLGEGQDYGVFFTPVQYEYEDRSPLDRNVFVINRHYDEMVGRHGRRECRKHVWFVQHDIGDQGYAIAAIMWGLPEVFADEQHIPEVKNGDLIEAPESGMWMYENNYMIDPVYWMYGGAQGLAEGGSPASGIFSHEARHMLGCKDNYAIGFIPLTGGVTMDDCYDRIHAYKMASLDRESPVTAGASTLVTARQGK